MGVCGDLIFLGVEWMYQQIWIIVGNIIKLMIIDDTSRMFIFEHLNPFGFKRILAILLLCLVETETWEWTTHLS